MSLILKLLTGKFGFFIMIAAVITFAGLTGAVKYYKSAYDAQVLENAIITERCLNNTNTLKNGIVAQNIALKKLSNQLEEAESVIDLSIIKATIVQKEHDILVTEALLDNKPIDCKASIRYLNDKAGEFKW